MDSPVYHLNQTKCLLNPFISLHNLVYHLSKTKACPLSQGYLRNLDINLVSLDHLVNLDYPHNLVSQGHSKTRGKCQGFRSCHRRYRSKDSSRDNPDLPGRRDPLALVDPLEHLRDTLVSTSWYNKPNHSFKNICL